METNKRKTYNGRSFFVTSETIWRCGVGVIYLPPPHPPSVLSYSYLSPSPFSGERGRRRQAGGRMSTHPLHLLNVSDGTNTTFLCFCSLLVILWCEEKITDSFSSKIKWSHYDSLVVLSFYRNLHKTTTFILVFSLQGSCNIPQSPFPRQEEATKLWVLRTAILFYIFFSSSTCDDTYRVWFLACGPVLTYTPCGCFHGQLICGQPPF